MSRRFEKREILMRLNNNKHKQSNWLKNTEHRMKNKLWLGLSRKIALRILAKIYETPEITKIEWAKKFDMSEKKLSKILKGQKNLDLKTIAKISSALQISLITFPEYTLSTPTTISTPDPKEFE